METRRILPLAAMRFLGPLDPGQVSLGPGIGAVLVVSPVSMGVSAFLGVKLSLGRIKLWRAVAQDQLPGSDSNQK